MMSTPNSSIINKILDMDLTDRTAMENVIDASTHQNGELLKAQYFYHDAYSPDDLCAYIFGTRDGPHVLVNIIESRHGIPKHEIPFECYGIECDIEDIPLPRVAFIGVNELIRIDVTSGREFTVRNITPSGIDECADGSFFYIRNIDANETIMSLYRREDGYKIVDELTSAYAYNSDYELVLTHETIDTFENKILNYVNLLQKYIRKAGEVITFAEGLLLGVNVTRPYEEEGQNILEVQLPDDGAVFMIAFDHMEAGSTRHEYKTALSSNMHNLLTHFVPDYAFNANRKRVTLLAITYNNDESELFARDEIQSVQYSTDNKVFKDVVLRFFDQVSLMDRCRHVILKNRHVMSSRIAASPSAIQTFIWSSERYSGLIDYQIEDEP